MDPIKLQLLNDGVVIPAHPLALNESRKLDEVHQIALTRYYLDAGAGGLAVGVHTTQFAIHDVSVGLYEPVLSLAKYETDRFINTRGPSPILIAGVIGNLHEAVREAEIAAEIGYDAVLLRPEKDLDEDLHIARARAVGEILPVIGFYLQRAAGGRTLSRRFWTRFADIESVIAVKIAPFDRYKTLDAVNGIADSARASEVALYTGNDDHIISDLLARFPSRTAAHDLKFVGGLLGQWSVWTHCAVDQLRAAHVVQGGNLAGLGNLLRWDAQLTDANGAIFDSRNNFMGCNPGIAEVLTRHGLLAGRWCLDPSEDLSTGQQDEIDRVWHRYPQLRDDDFIAANLDNWLSA